MNIQLLDPFSQHTPSQILTRLISPETTSTILVKFNRRGNMLACGTRDGKIGLWDTLTWKLVKLIKSHVSPISSLDWNRKGRTLLSTSRDWNLCLWNLSSFECDTIRFDGPVLEGKYHPHKEAVAVIVQGQAPLYIDLKTQTRSELSLNNASAFATCLLFSKDGCQLLVATTKASIHIFDTLSLDSIAVIPIPGSGLICQLTRSPSGSEILVNGADRCLRLYQFDGVSLELKCKYIDVVNRVQWAQCCFSADSEYVVGTCESSQKHNLYVYLFDKYSGGLFKMLEGPREGLADMAWHPNRPLFATISHFGTIYIWGVHYTQNFSAFAPSFTELDDNLTYVEREDEFDIKPIVPIDKPVFEDVQVDVHTIDFKDVSDSDDEDPFYLDLFQLEPL